MASPKPTIYLIAGCNGAGKTTFAKEFLPKEVKCLRFLNARVRERVRKGGHDVPAADVRRRFERSLRNLHRQYLPLADEWRILDNSGALPRLVADGTPAGTRVLDEAIFSAIDSSRR